MLLSDYTTQVQFLVHDQTNADFTQTELTNAIKAAEPPAQPAITARCTLAQWMAHGADLVRTGVTASPASVSRSAADIGCRGVSASSLLELANACALQRTHRAGDAQP